MKKKVNKKNTKNLLIYLVLAMIVIFFVILFIAYLKNRNQTPVSTETKIFQDADGYFSMQIPANWHTKTNYGTEQTGIGTAKEVTNKLEVINLASGIGAGINVLIYEAAPNCSFVQKPNTTIAGLPATYNPSHYNWTIYTSSATFSINYYYPGAGVFHRRVQISPSPVPQSVIEENQQVIDAILNSFQTKNLQAVRC